MSCWACGIFVKVSRVLSSKQWLQSPITNIGTSGEKSWVTCRILSEALSAFAHAPCFYLRYMGKQFKGLINDP